MASPLRRGGVASPLRRGCAASPLHRVCAASPLHRVCVWLVHVHDFQEFSKEIGTC